MLTRDPRFGAIAIHESGEKLVAITQADEQGNISDVLGASWTSPTGDSLFVFLGQDGLPARAVIEGIIALFSNYTDSTVDVAIILPDGTTQIKRALPVDAEDLLQLRQSRFSSEAGSPHLATIRSSYLELAAMLRIAGFTISIASCVLALYPPTLPFAILSCGSALINIVNSFPPDPRFEAVSRMLTVTSCYLGSALSCVNALISETADGLERAQRTLDEHAGDIASLEQEFGTPSVEISVHLKSDNGKTITIERGQSFVLHFGFATTDPAYISDYPPATVLDVRLDGVSLFLTPEDARSHFGSPQTRANSPTCVSGSPFDSVIIWAYTLSGVVPGRHSLTTTVRLSKPLFDGCTSSSGLQFSTRITLIVK
jgi:hypothetical protein